MASTEASSSSAASSDGEWILREDLSSEASISGALPLLACLFRSMRTSELK